MDVGFLLGHYCIELSQKPGMSQISLFLFIEKSVLRISVDRRKLILMVGMLVADTGAGK